MSLPNLFSWFEFLGREVSVDQEDSDSEKLSDDYEYSTITNEDDWHIHEDLDEAQKKLPDVSQH